MQMSKNGKRALDQLNTLYSGIGDEISLTEDRIKQDLADVLKWLRLTGVSEDEKRFIIRKIISIVGIEKMPDESIVSKEGYLEHDSEWFTKIKDEQCEWFNCYRAKLIAKDWSPNVIRELDRSSDAIMNCMGDPRSERFNVRGLIMGDIQSGKTANFIALCNKAADAGYRVIIVTAGVIEKLRRQTQGRLEKEFVDLLPRRQVATLTGKTYDFRKEQGKNPVNVFRPDIPVLCVVKKNVSVLQHLYKWLQKGVKKISEKGDISLPSPLLFIDDEADNASINTHELTEEANPTRTNELIRKILKSFQRSTYIGITATPFANVFIDPDTEDEAVADDLFPKSFVYRLTTPSNYFGAEKLFEPGSPYLEIIEDIDLWLPASHKKEEYPSEDLPQSLRSAIGYFLLVNGVMDVIGKEGDVIRHRSMMIHISRFVAMQNRIHGYVDAYLKRVRAKIKNYCGNPQRAEKVPELKFLHDIWDKYKLSVACNDMTWSKFLKSYLYDSVNLIETVVINSGRSVKSLDYEDGDKRVIVIGGNALSRGLTLEGLVVSYFRRNTMMSDTLLQMGRWCGYRGIYQSLVKVWMPEATVDNFGYACDISEDISEMFHQLVEQQGSPRDFAFKIRRSPGAMLPTARNKMRTATKVKFPIVLAGHAVETPRIKNDPQVVTSNNKTVCNFLKRNWQYLDTNNEWENMQFLRNVPFEEMSNMLSGFKAGMMSFGFMVPQIAEYISTLGVNWDVAIPVSKEEDCFVVDSELDIRVRKASRKLAVISSGREIMISGTKLKVTSGGAMRYILSPHVARMVISAYRAEAGHANKTPPDQRFLHKAKLEGCRPIVIIQYVNMSEVCKGSERPKATSFFALSFGFPGSKDDQIDQEFYFTKRAYEESELQELISAEQEV